MRCSAPQGAAFRCLTAATPCPPGPPAAAGVSLGRAGHLQKEGGRRRGKTYHAGGYTKPFRLKASHLGQNLL